jgi:hypothetical protein
MSILNKDQYQRRAENSAKRMEIQKQISSLTEEQHDAIAKVCSMRHDLHSNLDALLISESVNFSTFNSWLCGDNDESFNMLLKNVGIDNDLSWSPEDLPADDSMWSEFYSDYDEFYEEEYEIASNIHLQIENFLRKIDAEHGTSYAPTGFQRIL